jgi:hypothetical protein
MSKEIFKYGHHVTKEMIDEVLNDIYKSKVNREREFKFRVFFNNQKQADDWMKMFNNLLKEEIKNKYNE